MNYEAGAQEREFPGRTPAMDSVWNSRIQWGAILAGAFAGFAATIIMATLGGAIGITLGAAGVASADTASSDTLQKTALGAGIGAGVWMLLTAVVVGLAGGWALNATARRDRAYSSVLFAGLAWSVGVCLMLALAAPGMGGLFSGLGAGAGTAGAAAQARFPAMKSDSSTGTTDRAQSRSDRPMTDDEKAAARDAADKAAKAAATTAWFVLGAQILGLGATILAAGKNRHTGTRVVTEFRPRTAPM